MADPFELLMQQHSNQDQPAAVGTVQAPAPTDSAPSMPSAPNGQSADPFENLVASKQAESVAADTGDQEGSYNRPVPISPLSIGERALIANNKKAALPYLAQKFQDVKLSPEQGLLIKKDNQWHQADPSGLNSYFRDPWELTKDLADFAPEALNALATTPAVAQGAATGAAVGTAVAGPVGTAVGGVIGGLAGAAFGGAAAKTVETSLGRAIGTYQATPQEQVQDIGLESMYSMGGQAIALGAKPAFNALVKGLNYVKESASPAVKDALSAAWGSSTGKGAGVIRPMLEDADGYSSMLKQAAGKGGNIVDEASKISASRAEDFIDAGLAGRSKAYAQGLTNIFDKAEAKGATISPKEIFSDIEQNLMDNGFGKIGGDLQKGLSFTKYTPAEKFARSQANPEVVTKSIVVDPVVEKALTNVLNEVHPYLSVKEASGKGAVKILTDIKTSTYNVLDQAFAEAGEGTINANKPAVAQLAQIKNYVRNSFNSQFEKNGLADDFRALQSGWEKSAQDVSYANRELLKSKSNPEAALNFARKLADTGSKTAGTRGWAEAIVKLGGAEGEKAYKDALLANSVANTADWLPKMSMPAKIGLTATGGSALGAGHIAVAGINPIAAMVGGAAATQFSPKLVANQIRAANYIGSKVGAGTAAIVNPTVQYAFQSLNFLRSLSPVAMKQLLNDPRMVSQVFQAPVEGTQKEQHGIMQLLQQGGAIPPQGGQNGQ